MERPFQEPMPSFVELRKKIGYPDVPMPGIRDWNIDLPQYRPTYYTAEKVQQHASQPETPNWHALTFRSYEGEVQRDALGRPLNPAGRTGIEGRGKLWKWGPNFASDAILTREIDSQIEALVIERQDTGQLAFPGGFDEGQDSRQSAERELFEEARISYNMLQSEPLFVGVAATSLRNTDNAWIETAAHYAHVGKEGQLLVPRPADDAKSAMWLPLAAIDICRMSDAHASYTVLLKNRFGMTA
ncbi:MAG TPA: NUDIX domain-containing protein [Verrucomicrobiae bacterium]|nr:NUDIX domain-containing protein [Verrucomicrobiae bacterium]